MILSILIEQSFFVLKFNKNTFIPIWVILLKEFNWKIDLRNILFFVKFFFWLIQ